MRIFLAIALLFPSIALAQDAKRPTEPPGLMRCCVTKVYDASGKVFGDVITYEVDRDLEYVIMKYKLKDGDTIALRVSYEYVQSKTAAGGSSVIFTSSDCSGDAFVPMGPTQPTVRQAVVLPVGPPSYWGASGALLYVSGHLATRVMPAPGTIFHSQWDYTGMCTTYPAPGYTFVSGPPGGFWMKKVEDLYVSFKRPYYFK